MNTKGKLKDAKTTNEQTAETLEDLKMLPETVVKVTLTHGDGSTSDIEDFDCLLIGAGSNNVSEDGDEGMMAQFIMQGSSSSIMTLIEKSRHNIMDRMNPMEMMGVLMGLMDERRDLED